MKQQWYLLVCLFLYGTVIGGGVPVIVMTDFNSADLSEEENDNLSEALLKRLSKKSHQVSLISRNALSVVLEDEGIEQQWCDDLPCAVGIGTIVGADYVLFGGVSTVGNSRILHIHLVETKSQKIIYTASEFCPQCSIDELPIKVIPLVTKKVMNKILQMRDVSSSRPRLLTRTPPKKKTEKTTVTSAENTNRVLEESTNTNQKKETRKKLDITEWHEDDKKNALRKSLVLGVLSGVGIGSNVMVYNLVRENQEIASDTTLSKNRRDAAEDRVSNGQVFLIIGGMLTVGAVVMSIQKLFEVQKYNELTIREKKIRIEPTYSFDKKALGLKVDGTF